jgi:aerobic-type carbon monoxide dehydrogenase small subunit (CoxS/CutS family)
MRRAVAFAVNGRPVRLDTDDERPLLWVLRSDLGLTGTKYGCGEGLCGACTVLVNEEAVRSCTTTLREVEGKKVVTIEGLGAGESLHPLQKAFVEHGAFQCGYCTSGMILSAQALLHRNPRPTDAEIVAHLDDNLCRCGSHVRILEAIRSVAASAKGVGR